MDVGEVKTFAYTGNVQSYTIPVSGVYKLICVGANGARDKFDTNHGGYAVGYKILKKGEIIYVCCGQAGSFGDKKAFNGGGAGIQPVGNVWNNPSGGGGGATHFALIPGTLEAIGEGNKSKVLIVAGGAGGESGHTGSGAYPTYVSEGGYGGGESGGYGGDGTEPPGTQKTGYAFGKGQDATRVDVYAYDALACGAGGGGFFGGYAGSNGVAKGGGGGSGYIGGVPEFVYKDVSYKPSMTSDYNKSGSNGYASITLMAKTTIPVVFNGKTLETIIYNGVEITGLIYDGIRVFSSKLKGVIRCLKCEETQSA